MADSDPIVVQENWENYSYRLDAGSCFVSFYAGADDVARDEFPFCARVIIPIKSPNQNGGPTGEEAETLWRLEDELTDALMQHGTKCMLLARMTHAGDRELVFQLADWDKFRPPVGRWMKRAAEYEVNVSEHDGWDFFDDCVWPSEEDWMLIQDQRVVDGLIQSGSNPNLEHALDFLFIGDQSRLQQLRQRLAARGYVDSDESTPTDQLLMVKKLPLELNLIYTESLENNRLCKDLGVQFDGWGAAVVN